MLLFLEGHLTQVADTDEENIRQWIAYTRASVAVNAVGVDQYLLARAGATGGLRDAVDAVVMAKLSAVHPQTSVPKTANARRAAQITHNWVRQFAADTRVPESVRSRAAQLLEAWVG
ncbi:hypothetical protein [Lacticaseibacillus absianus]|uniref:hypothetical protein n=1 Tax=Lacticaseibacillus absianus TaxID=2729623 RepID=UPI0015C9988E|nr:hypothetical protein [Lacticaseibacillus absianus]